MDVQNGEKYNVPTRYKEILNEREKTLLADEIAVTDWEFAKEEIKLGLKQLNQGKRTLLEDFLKKVT